MQLASDSAEGGERGERIVSIQLLRFLAALGVLVLHAELFGYHLGRFLQIELTRYTFTLKGGFGVDVFFAISGFVMVHSSRRLYGTPGGRTAFVSRRLLRIVPLYWLCTLVALAWALHFGPRLDLAGIVQSFAFSPFRSAAASGRVAPVLEVGWTLNYEMLFYLIFAATLASTAGATVRRVALVLSGLVLLRLAVDLPLPLGAWGRPIILEFAAGMSVALLHARGITLPLWARLALVGAALVLVAVGNPDWSSDLAGWSRVLSWGVAGAAVLAAATLGQLRVTGARCWNFGGDISYALYLCHLPIMNAAQMTWRHFHLPYGRGLEALFVTATIVVSLIAAAILHIAVERPLTRWLNARMGTLRAGSRPGENRRIL